MGTAFLVPDQITFEAAIKLTQNVLDQLSAEQPEPFSPESLQTIVAQLVATRNGARGFFVAYLTDDRSFADHPDPAVITALKTEPEEVSELLIKNLAMSTAMAITHRRSGQLDQAEQSLRVSRRSADIIQRVGGDSLKSEARALLEGLTVGSGSYGTFLKKWGYDPEQKAAMAEQLQKTLPELERP